MAQSGDYILRMIERFGQFAIALRKLILGDGGSGEVGNLLLSTARHAGLDLDIARIATPETLMLLVAPSGELEPARCWMCAETLYLDGLAAEQAGDPQRALDSYAKARMLFSAVAPMGAFLAGYPEAKERVEEIEARVQGLDDTHTRPTPGRPRSRGRRLRVRA